jgi:peptidyl-prolyl cis-trans isomerase SurA
MNLRIFRTPAAFVISTALLASHALAQGAQPAAPSSPYGGETVEEIIVRINDQIISRSDYERAMKEMPASTAHRCRRSRPVTKTCCAT